MSYKKKKKKKNIINQLKRRVGLIKIVLFKKINKIIKKEVNVQQIQTRKIMQWLRDRSRVIRPNNSKISDWVDQYTDNCILNGKPVEILTQYCLSKALERRFAIEGNQFIPLKRERQLFEEEIPKIITIFKKSGLKINWLITFNRSPVDTGLLPKEIEVQYKNMIFDLAENPLYQECIIFADWEDDFLGQRQGPDQDVLKNYFTYVKKDAFDVRLEQLTTWSRDVAGLDKSRDELTQDIMLEAACEAEEAKILSGNSSPFGTDNFIIIPLETVERYDSFTIFVKDFKKRIVPVLKPYPWRMDAEKLGYTNSGE